MFRNVNGNKTVQYPFAFIATERTFISPSLYVHIKKIKKLAMWSLQIWSFGTKFMIVKNVAFEYCHCGNSHQFLLKFQVTLKLLDYERFTAKTSIILLVMQKITIILKSIFYLCKQWKIPKFKKSRKPPKFNWNRNV